jgi:dihydrofolate reductase
MRKVVVAVFVSLDGVVQAPGNPDEDPTGGFRFGGWTAPYWDDAIGAAVGENFGRPFDLLLGRRTYDIFAAHWPYIVTDPKSPMFDPMSAQIAQAFNACTKYVATHRPETLTWQNTRALGADIVASLREIKKASGPDLVVQGSTELIHQLLAADLIDDLKLLTYPVVFGRGKRWFDSASQPAAYKLDKTVAARSGVVINSYRREGEITTGTFSTQDPSPAELERRKNLK